MVSDRRTFGSASEHIDALMQCWTPYLDHGRRALLALGDKVTVAPELANGYGVADLVIDRTLVEVKLAIEPTAHDIAIWLRQLLGYVLLDRHDTFQLDTVAIYCGWQGLLLTYPIDALVVDAGRDAPPSVAAMRADFHEAMRADLDGYTAWKERQRQS